MPPAMHLTLLVSLFTVTVCQNTSDTSSPAQNSTLSTATPTRLGTLTPTKKNNVARTPAANTSSISHQQAPTTRRAVTTPGETRSAPPSASQHTPNGTTVTHGGGPLLPTNASRTTNQTVSVGPAASPTNTTATAGKNTTSGTPAPVFGSSDLAANPGLVAVICIFCIVLALAMVVATVKCVRSPRASFERLEDVPMNKVTEGSPFARYSK